MVWLQHAIWGARFEGSNLYEYDSIRYRGVCVEFDGLRNYTKKLVFISIDCGSDCMYGISIYGLDLDVFESVFKGMYRESEYGNK